MSLTDLITEAKAITGRAVPVVDLKTAATMTGESVTSLRRAIAAGHLVAMQTQRTAPYRIHVSAIDAYRRHTTYQPYPTLNTERTHT